MDGSAALVSNAVRVRAFLNAGTSRPIETSEYMTFWKACSLEERQQFNDEVVKMGG